MISTTEELYESTFVWAGDGRPSCRVYCCFRRLSDGLYCVQNTSYFYPDHPGSEWARVIATTGALFLDGDMAGRDWFLTLAAAIAQHDADFADMKPAC
jgi:hypothetical protein